MRTMIPCPLQWWSVSAPGIVPQSKEKEEQNKRFHKVEREYGKLVRRFGLPNEVDASNAQERVQGRRAERAPAEIANGKAEVHRSQGELRSPCALTIVAMRPGQLATKPPYGVWSWARILQWTLSADRVFEMAGSSGGRRV
jgi:hypothetical protein